MRVNLQSAGSPGHSVRFAAMTQTTIGLSLDQPLSTRLPADRAMALAEREAAQLQSERAWQGKLREFLTTLSACLSSDFEV